MNTDDYSFEELLSQFNGIIQEECIRFQGQARMDELTQTARIAIWYANMTYQAGLCDFVMYIKESLREALKSYVTKSHIGTCFFSLNKKIGKFDVQEEALAFIRAPEKDKDLSIMVYMFIGHLVYLYRNIVYDIMDGSSDEEILEAYHLSYDRLAQIKKSLRSVWVSLYGSDINDFYWCVLLCPASFIP